MQRSALGRYEEEEEEEKIEEGRAPGLTRESSVSCPVCGANMVFIQTCHLRCPTCGAELSCEDKGWFWG